MFYIYILRSLKSGRYYIGSTENLEKRLADHNRGKVVSTRSKGRWKVVYSEEFSTRCEAMKREIQIKSYKGRNAFKKLLN